jgi:hypothetical protein
MILYLCVLIVFSLRRESLKLTLAMNPFPRWFCHNRHAGQAQCIVFNSLTIVECGEVKLLI